MYRVQVHSTQYVCSVAYKSGGGVAHVQSGDYAHILGGVIGHEHASHRPIDNVDPGEVSRTDGDIALSAYQGLAQSRQILGVMREVGVHFAYVLVSMSQTPTEAFDIGRTKTEFARAFDDVYTPGVLRHFFAHDGGGAVGRVVVNHEDVERRVEGQYGIYDGGCIFLLVIHGDDYESVCFGLYGHLVVLWCCMMVRTVVGYGCRAMGPRMLPRMLFFVLLSLVVGLVESLDNFVGDVECRIEVQAGGAVEYCVVFLGLVVFNQEIVYIVAGGFGELVDTAVVLVGASSIAGLKAAVKVLQFLNIGVVAGFAEVSVVFGFFLNGILLALELCTQFVLVLLQCHGYLVAFVHCVACVVKLDKQRIAVDVSYIGGGGKGFCLGFLDGGDCERVALGVGFAIASACGGG